MNRLKSVIKLNSTCLLERFIFVGCYLFLCVDGQSQSTDSKFGMHNQEGSKPIIESRSLRIWQPKFYAIDFKDAPYQYFNENGLSDYVSDEVVLSRDGNRLAVKGSNKNADNFYALYSAGEPFGKNEWVYYERPGNLPPQNIPGQSISFSYDTNSIAIGYSRCDSSVEYTTGLVCIQVNDRRGPNYNVVTNADEHGFTWGKSVSLSEDGAFMAVGTSEGVVYVYNTFALLLTNDLALARMGNPIIVGDSERVDSNIGEIVKMTGDQSNPTVVIGGKGDQVMVYRFNSKTNIWSKLGSDIPTGGSGDIFDVSHQGYIVAVAYRETAVHVYHRKTSSDGNTEWVRHGQDIMIDIKKSLSLSISDNGKILAVGAYGGGTPGKVEVFEFVNHQWDKMSSKVEGKVDKDADVDFGRSVSLSGDGFTLAVGAPARAGVGIAKRSKGYAMVFELGDPFPSTMPSENPYPSVSPSQPSELFNIDASNTPSMSPKPSTQPSISTQPSFVPTSPPTPSTCLFNCNCKDGMSCDLSQCESNCNCEEGNCNMQSCKFDCRCEGGNCDMRRCGSNCQCPKRGCHMDYCVYHGGCVNLDAKLSSSNIRSAASEGSGMRTLNQVVNFVMAIAAIIFFV